MPVKMEPAAANVRSELIDLIEAAVDDGAPKSLVPQVAHHEIMSSVSKIHEISSPPQRTQTSFRFSRWARWQPINPPAPRTNAHFTISALLLAILTANTPPLFYNILRVNRI